MRSSRAREGKSFELVRRGRVIESLIEEQLEKRRMIELEDEGEELLTRRGPGVETN